MPIDNTEPRTALIFKVGFASIVAIVSARYALVSYFDQEINKEYAAKLGTNEVVASLHAEADKALHGGPMPIDKAMALVATRPRQALTSIAPKPSDDTAALIGWTQRPQPPAPVAGSWATLDADASTQSNPTGTDGGAGLPSATTAGPAGSAAAAAAAGASAAPPSSAAPAVSGAVSPPGAAPSAAPKAHP